MGREEVKGVGVGVNGTELEGREGELQWVWFIFFVIVLTCRGRAGLVEREGGGLRGTVSKALSQNVVL